MFSVRWRMDRGPTMIRATQFWNTTPAEEVADYPAHRFARDPWRPLIRAVDVDASPAVVYRWLCQLKVAPYSYDWIDNGGRRSPRTLTPRLGELAIGQRGVVIFGSLGFPPG